MSASIRMVTSPPRGTPSTYFEMGSSRLSFPSAASCTVSVPVKVLVMDPTRW